MSKNHKNRTEIYTEKKHVVLPDVSLPPIHEPKPLCSICSEPIESIIEAISEKDGSFSHFDCVMNKLRNEYKVVEPDILSYVGSGSFAVFTKNEEGKFIIKEKINYETVETFNSMKKYVEGTRNE